MLIKRTIDKPKEKLALLSKYLRENDISFYPELHRQGIIRCNEFYIDEDLLAQILNVTKNTLRNWEKKYKILYKRNHDFQRLLPKKWTSYYIELESVYFFLRTQDLISNRH